MVDDVLGWHYLGLYWATRSNLRVSVGCIIPYLIYHVLTYPNGLRNSLTGPILPANVLTVNDDERTASLIGIRIPPPKIIDDSPSYPTPRGNQ